MKDTTHDRFEKFFANKFQQLGKTRRLTRPMKEKQDWFEKYQQQKEKRMKKLLPGKTFARDLMKPGGLTLDQVAKDIAVQGVTPRHMNEIVHGSSAITF